MSDSGDSRLIAGYDAALFDLDGVIYLGPLAVPGAVEVVAQLEATGKTVVFVSNNAAPSPESVVSKLQQLGFAAEAGNVLTSAQVAANSLGETLPAGSKVLVAGSPSLARLVAEAGLVPVDRADDDPVAVLQGYDPVMSWPLLDEVCLAIAQGALWYATNDDASRPTDRGLVPGAGGMIAVVASVIDGSPTTFGKPHRPMMAEAVRLAGATRPIFVGDRIDTDIIGANNAGMDSLMVFSGAHGKRDLVAAGAGARPTHIGADIGALLRPPRRVTLDDQAAGCDGQRVIAEEGRIRLVTTAASVEEQLDALWAVAALAWSAPYLDPEPALTALDLLN
jgi:HAD superfamily hydrolase (TIGR01450 family)